MADPGRPVSLKRRLTAALLGGVASIWLAMAAYTYFDALHEVNELLDAHLAQSASLIMAQAEHELEEVELEHAPTTHERARQVVFQIWEGGSVLRLHSAHAPETRLAARESGYASAEIERRTWRVFSTWDAGHRFLVQVGERDDTRREIAASIAGSLLAPVFVALPVLGLFIWLAIGRGIRPLHRVGEQLAGREAGDLRPLAEREAPGEVAPLIRSLNAMFERVERLIENERRFTADAAHELRTPLAALKTQAQVARAEDRDAERRHALDGVIAGCDRAARLVEQLLTLARLDPGPGARAPEACEAGEVARRVIADLAPAALEKGIDIELAAAELASIAGYPDLIAILLRNLIDNAVRYSTPGGRVRVETRRTGEGLRIVVEDEGPGVPPEELAKVGQRFYRVAGTGEAGSGLGLSIARRIAEIHAGRLALEQPESGKGLRATVALMNAKT